MVAVSREMVVCEGWGLVKNVGGCCVMVICCGLNGLPGFVVDVRSCCCECKVLWTEGRWVGVI